MKPLKEHLPTQEWVDNRKEYIGGSDVSTILEKNPYSTPLQLWMRKQGILPPIESTPLLKAGHYLEPLLASHFEETTGLKTRQVNKTYQSTEHSFLRANIDRMVLAGNGLKTTAVLELKTTTSHRMKSLDYQIAPEYFYQIQHYLAITGFEQGYLQIYERDTCEFLEPMIVDRADDLIIDNMNKLIEWWQVHMIEGKRPAPINGEDMLILYPDSTDGAVEATPGAYALYTELNQVRDRKDELETREEYLKTRLKEKLGESERLVCGGKTLISWKSSTQNRLNTSEFRKDHPELYRKYIKQTKTRRFTVK